MPISNYTTTINVEKTVAEISKMLARFGARRVSIMYDPAGEVAAVDFVVSVRDMPVQYILPANAEGVLRTFERDGVTGKYRTEMHARRVAWRIVRDWVEAQLALVDANQAAMAEVFLPYAVTKSGTTIWQEFESGRAKLLTDKT